MKSVMSHNFSQVPKANIPRSSFNRSHGYKTTFDAGDIVPIFTDEVLPGDTFKLKTTLFGRLATPIFPIMDNLYMETFYFFVPNRLLWDNWEKFNGAQEDPSDSIDFTIPQVQAPSGFTEGSIGDYFGLPTQIGTPMEVSALHFRAHNLIYNEWFRDQNLQDSRPKNMGDGPDDLGDYGIYRRGKRHDYFTSCLPWPQKGDGVELPLGTSAPVYGNGKTLGLTDGTNNAGIFNGSATDDPALIDQSVYNTNVGTAQTNTGDLITDAGIGVVESGESGLYADLSSASAATINSLRQAFMFQAVLERDARGGTRYTEMIKSHFGVTNPDFRLQRPEYLGGSSTRININPVQQTSSTDGTTPQGNLAAFGIAADSHHGFTKSFTEHGVIIGYVNVRADLTYQQGLPKMWSRQTRFDFYLPTLAHLGEQAVLNKEIYYDDDGFNDDAFGYQERWAEYRYKQSQITGAFRSNASASLDAWHLSQEFETRPSLDTAFIKDRTSKTLGDRVIAVDTEPDMLLDCYFQLTCARPMPTYSVPGLASHF